MLQIGLMLIRIRPKLVLLGILFVGAMTATGCATHPRSHAEHAQPPEKTVVVGEGRASWYGPGFHGRKTASGERFNQGAMTCAHRKLPFGSKIKVTNLTNDQSVVVTVNDRGPFIPGRIVDLSRGAAQQIDMIRTGTAPVRVEIVHTDEL